MINRQSRTHTLRLNRRYRRTNRHSDTYTPSNSFTYHPLPQHTHTHTHTHKVSSGSSNDSWGREEARCQWSKRRAKSNSTMRSLPHYKNSKQQPGRLLVWPSSLVKHQDPESVCTTARSHGLRHASQTNSSRDFCVDGS